MWKIDRQALIVYAVIQKSNDQENDAGSQRSILAHAERARVQRLIRRVCII